MRAPFDTTFATYTYPIGGGAPLPLGGPFIGRLVESDQIGSLTGLAVGSLVWLTTEESLPSVAFSYVYPAEAVVADMTVTTVLAIPHTAAPNWVVVEQQAVLPIEGNPYYRYILTPL